MARHVAGPRRRAERYQPRRRLKPRYGRVVAAVSALAITALAVLGGFGMLPGGEDEPIAYAGTRSVTANTATSAANGAAKVLRQAQAYADQMETERTQASEEAERREKRGELPENSGEGRRAVFDQSSQRVWIVGSDGTVDRTYLVSGSVLDNLQPGSYEVFSRSRHATGIQDSGVMEYFVRFTRGKNAAIGFHSIPTLNGEPLQTRAELGTPLSHGCIRQARPDAIAMWEFAQIGTKVVVTA